VEIGFGFAEVIAMDAPRILILSDQDLFAQAIRSLIETRSKAQIIAVEHYQEDAATHARELRPDLIILGDDEGLPLTLLPSLLDCLPETYIVRLSLTGDILRVYEGHQLVASQSHDLVKLIESLTMLRLPKDDHERE
jgi:DNA-binding NarL/FixJ family response regulator